MMTENLENKDSNVTSILWKISFLHDVCPCVSSVVLSITFFVDSAPRARMDDSSPEPSAIGQGVAC